MCGTIIPSSHTVCAGEIKDLKHGSHAAELPVGEMGGKPRKSQKNHFIYKMWTQKFIRY